jgi:hypothetical protein
MCPSQTESGEDEGDSRYRIDRCPDHPGCDESPLLKVSDQTKMSSSKLTLKQGMKEKIGIVVGTSDRR